MGRATIHACHVHSKVDDFTEAVEIGPRVWWVGTLIPDDEFQCHVYLIEQGDQSVIIDPGSALIADEIVRKVDSIVGVDHVRWLVCSHSDPDILGAIPALVKRGLHPEASIVTHWRDEALMRHSGIDLPYWRIEEHDWLLALDDRTLRFVFTPYAHFAGSFCTFDEKSATLFSSDLFGGFTDGNSLFATSVDYFEAMRAFHEHYMPSREIVSHALARIRELPIRTIAPQHGHLIPQDLIEPIISKLDQLECGIYLLARDDPGLRFLLTSSRIVRQVMDVVVGETDFAVVGTRICELARSVLGAETVDFWAIAGAATLRFGESDGFTGQAENPPPDVVDALAGRVTTAGPNVVLPLVSHSTEAIGGVAVLIFGSAPHLDNPTLAVLDQIGGLVEAGLEREVLRRLAEFDRVALYEQSTHDPLTGLYNRVYLDDAARRLGAIDDRRDAPGLAVLMVDIDHFKRVNDSYGHPVGDLVLSRVARAIHHGIRPDDLAIRFGGEEFLVILSGVDLAGSQMIGERIRSAVALDGADGPPVTISVGLALRHAGESFDVMVKRADEALYQAKADGRDRLQVA